MKKNFGHKFAREEKFKELIADEEKSIKLFVSRAPAPEIKIILISPFYYRALPALQFPARILSLFYSSRV